MSGIAGRVYLERGEPVTAVVAWRQQRKTERLDLPGLERLGAVTPRNVLVRRADGSEVVRPFRGLRKVGPDGEGAPVASRRARADTRRRGTG